VSWPEVNRFITAAVAQANAGPLPVAGTPAWCSLADSDPRKLLALAAAGEHHVLRCDLAQAASSDAAKALAATSDWTEISRAIRAGRGRAYIPRRKETA
jgi:hypothetical protein